METENNNKTMMLSGNNPFVLDGRDRVWEITEGRASVFFMKINPDGSPGRRFHLFTVNAGDIAIGMNYGASVDFRLLMSGSPSAAVSEKASGEFIKKISGDPDNIENSTLVERWVDNLTFALLGWQMAPRSVKFIEAGENIEISGREICGAKHGELLWIELTKGEIELLSKYRVLCAGHKGFFPVTNKFWFQVFDERPAGSYPEDEPSLIMNAYSTQQYFRRDNWFETFEIFHKIILWLLEEKIENSEYEEKVRLDKKILKDGCILSDSLTGFAAIADGKFHVETFENYSSDELVAACQIVGAAQNVKIVIPPSLKDASRKTDPVADIARASRVRHRRLLLRENWWTEDAGPMLAFYEKDSKPVALIPTSSSGYAIHDPVSKTRRPVKDADSKLLSATAYMFYRPLPHGILSIFDIIKYCYTPSLVRDITLIFIVGIALGLINMIIPMASSVIFDTIIPEVERTQMLWLLMILITSAFSVFLFQAARSYAMLRFESRIDASLQAAIWDRLIALPAPFFRLFSTGDLTMRAMSIISIRRALSSTVLNSLMTCIFSVFNFFLMFYYDMKLAGVACLMVLVAVCFYAATFYFQSTYTKRNITLDGKLSGLVFGILNGISKFRVAGAENRAFGLWAKLFREKKAIPIYILTNATSVFNSIYSVICTGIFFWWIGSQGKDAAFMSAGSFLAFNSAFSTFFSGMIEMSSTMTSLLNVVTLYDRARPILETLPEFDENRDDPGELTGRIELSHVSFRYKDDLPQVLTDISINIKPGSFVAFVGPSGSGKSTLLRLLLGFDKPGAGSILYDGQELSKIDVRSVRQQMGVVLQNGQLTSGSIMSNITGSSLLTIDDAWEAAEMAGLSNDIREMPMQMFTMISEGASTISGGQKQRLLIARALVKKPRIILFDEATSALDNQTQTIVSKSLEGLLATRIVIAHRLSTIIKADMIYVIEKGRLVQSGTYDELMKQEGLFVELAKRQLA